MVTGRVRIDSLEAGRTHLGAVAVGDPAALVVLVRRSVPPWLATLVAEAAGQPVIVEAAAPAGLVGEALAGWEIGVATAAFAAGAVEVEGIDPRRVARVREVTALLAAHAPQAAPLEEPAP